MTIDPSDPRLTAYAVGELPPGEVTAFEEALEHSPEALVEVGRIRETADLLRREFEAELETLTGGPAAREPALYVVEAGGDEPLPVRTGLRRRNRIAIAALAASLLAAAVVSVSWYAGHRQSADGVTDVTSGVSAEDPAVAFGEQAGPGEALMAESILFTGESPGFYLASAEADRLLQVSSRYLGDDLIEDAPRILAEDPVSGNPQLLPAKNGVAIPAYQGRDFGLTPAVPGTLGYQLEGLDPQVSGSTGYVEIARAVSGDDAGVISQSLYMVNKDTDGEGNSSIRLKGHVQVTRRESKREEVELRGTDGAVVVGKAREVTKNPETGEMTLAGGPPILQAGDKVIRPTSPDAEIILREDGSHVVVGRSKMAFPVDSTPAKTHPAAARPPDGGGGRPVPAERAPHSTTGSGMAAPDPFDAAPGGAADFAAAGGTPPANGPFDRFAGRLMPEKKEAGGRRESRQTGTDESRSRNAETRGRERDAVDSAPAATPGMPQTLSVAPPVNFEPGPASGDPTYYYGYHGRAAGTGASGAHPAAAAAAGVLVQPGEPVAGRWRTEVPPVAPSAPVPGRGKFAQTVDNPFCDPMEKALSTFSVDVDTASYTEVRRMILTDGQLPHRDQVRIEEFINYFDYESYPAPDLARVEEAEAAPFSVNLECAAAPWNAAHRIVRIGLKGAEIPTGERPAANLVFLLDVSGSMSSEDKLPLMQRCLRELVSQLREDDRITMVVYASKAGEVLEPTPGTDHRTILEAVNALTAKGSTNGEGGIRIAYQRARENFIEGGVNRILLATDGDFNVGQDSDEELVSLIEKEAKSGVELTVLGFGTGNLNDSMLEKITNKGNGQFHYIDRIEEGRKVLVEELSSSLVTIAKDVKLQVEFNPGKVAAYRLIGYANRVMPREDFHDDTKDAGEIGAGHTVTALYEVVPIEVLLQATAVEPVDDLKYKKAAVEEEAGAESPIEQRRRLMKKQGLELVDSPELMTVRLRFKRPGEEASEKLEFPLVDPDKEFGDASADFRFATAVGAFGEWLRIEQGRPNHQLGKIARIAHESIEADEFGRKQEFVDVVKAAAKRNGGGAIHLEEAEEGEPAPPNDVGSSVTEKLRKLR